MKIEESKQSIRWCILGAIGGILMAAGDWLLGCVPLQKTDTGMFNRACYLSGAYALWNPALVVGMGTHEELMQFCKVYREIATSQLSAAELA